MVQRRRVKFHSEDCENGSLRNCFMLLQYNTVQYCITEYCTLAVLLTVALCLCSSRFDGLLRKLGKRSSQNGEGGVESLL